MKSISAIAILGIFTTILLVIMMLFTLESSPTIKNAVNIANEIEFDQNLDFVSITQAAEKCRVLVISNVSKDDDLKKEVQEIGNYIWRKFSIEAGFEELEIIFQGKIGSGCYQDTVIVKSNIENPIKRK